GSLPYVLVTTTVQKEYSIRSIQDSFMIVADDNAVDLCASGLALAESGHGSSIYLVFRFFAEVMVHHSESRLVQSLCDELIHVSFEEAFKEHIESDKKSLREITYKSTEISDETGETYLGMTFPDSSSGHWVRAARSALLFHEVGHCMAKQNNAVPNITPLLGLLGVSENLAEEFLADMSSIESILFSSLFDGPTSSFYPSHMIGSLLASLSVLFALDAIEKDIRDRVPTGSWSDNNLQIHESNQRRANLLRKLCADEMLVGLLFKRAGVDKNPNLEVLGLWADYSKLLEKSILSSYGAILKLLDDRGIRGSLAENRSIDEKNSQSEKLNNAQEELQALRIAMKAIGGKATLAYPDKSTRMDMGFDILPKWEEDEVHASERGKAKLEEFFSDGIFRCVNNSVLVDSSDWQT
ncbi:MAG: hypothetical protein AAF709_12590, partial [Pseudomonadota bacterium]